MNTQRVLVLGVAALAAGAAALLARGLLGGGTEKVKAAVPLPRPATTEVLVASIDLQPGTALLPTSVRWQAWPKSSVDSSFISQAVASDPSPIVHGAVTRAPLVAGEPLTPSMMVHADSAGFMAAMVDPGMRAVSVAITTETGAGGFILPNDRVDVIITRQISDVPKRFASHTILTNVRVLAVDQTYKEVNDQKVVLAKTATLELSPYDAEQLDRSGAAGTVSLALRALGDGGTQQTPVASTATHTAAPPASAGPQQPGTSDSMTIIGYGLPRSAGGDQGD